MTYIQLNIAAILTNTMMNSQIAKLFQLSILTHVNVKLKTIVFKFKVFSIYKYVYTTMTNQS